MYSYMLFAFTLLGRPNVYLTYTSTRQDTAKEMWDD